MAVSYPLALRIERLSNGAALDIAAGAEYVP
jgi:hypothetical protein